MGQSRREREPFRISVARCLAATALLASAMTSAAQPTSEPRTAPENLVNGDMESLDADGRLVGWLVPPALVEAGYAIGPEREIVAHGEGAAQIDSRAIEPHGDTFGNLMQGIDAEPFRGKRVRFRAAVRVSDAQPGGRAQMWLRVDLESAGGAPRMGFFDNMDDRPIEEESWREYEIVGDVAEDARYIVLGVLTLGRCVALVDDARLEIVGRDAPPTGGAAVSPSAETQPFFTWWLLLPLVALAMFALAVFGRGRLGKFALAFTLAYWTLYALPTLVAGLLPFVGDWLGLAYEAGPVDAVVRWTAASVLGVDGTLVSALENGSGDTTYSYVQALVTFVLALVVAAAWSIADRRTTDRPLLKELLRSGLRYYLAMTLMGYGLAKLGTAMNQFPPPGLARLTATYGSSSPMGLLWTFMGSSPAYTALAGGMEAACALLLVFRRTSLLGGLASAAVMLNVMLLNFCYDVPVKLFSFHLVVAACCIALPDAGRLAHCLLGIGSGAPSDWTPAHPLRGTRAAWFERGVHAYFVLMIVVLPIFAHVGRERALAEVAPALGEWKLRTLEIGGNAVTPETGEVEWLTLSRWPTRDESGWSADYVATLVGGASASGRATLTRDALELGASEGAGSTSRLLPGEYAWTVEGGELHLDATLAGGGAGSGVRAILVPAAREFLLTSRGFRWINERPFNR